MPVFTSPSYTNILACFKTLSPASFEKLVPVWEQVQAIKVVKDDHVDVVYLQICTPLSPPCRPLPTTRESAPQC